MTDDDPDITSRRERLGASYQQDGEARTINHGHTRIVKSLRILLPLIAIGVIAALVFTSGKDEPALPIEKLKTPIISGTQQTASNKPVIEKNELVNPQFESQTKDGKTYKITANNAVQELKQPDLILLESPKGTLEIEPYPLLISAKDGTYNQKTQFITLNENVKISQEETGEIHLKTLEADLSRGEMFSPHPVEAEGTYGKLSANSMRITDDGMKITFEGPASLTINEGFDTWVE